MEKYLDETIHSGSTGWTTLITVYHLYKCDNDGTCQSRMDIVDYAGLFLVSSDYLKFDQGREMLVLTYLLDISLSSLYTHPIQYINVSSSFVVFQSSMCFPCIRWIQGVGEGHSLRWLEMYVNLVGTMKPMLTITQRGFRYYFRCL